MAGYGISLQGARHYDSIYFKHAYGQDIAKVLGNDFRTYYRFTIVRDPWSWTVSNYVFNRGLHRPWTRGTPHERLRFRRTWLTTLDFKTWVEWWLRELKPQQSKMVTDARGVLLVDDIFKFEDLNRALATVCDRLGLPALPLPPPETPTQTERYRSYYDKESWQRVAEHFREDCTRFNYSGD